MRITPIKKEILLKAGYKIVRSHVEAKKQFDVEYIKPVGKNDFPRYHIQSKNGVQIFHYDTSRIHQRDTGTVVVKKEKVISCELNRLNLIEKYYKALEAIDLFNKAFKNFAKQNKLK